VTSVSEKRVKDSEWTADLRLANSSNRRIYVCMHACMYVRDESESIIVCMYVCMYACMYVCMYVCIIVYIMLLLTTGVETDGQTKLF